MQNVYLKCDFCDEAVYKNHKGALHIQCPECYIFVYSNQPENIRRQTLLDNILDYVRIYPNIKNIELSIRFGVSESHCRRLRKTKFISYQKITD